MAAKRNSAKGKQKKRKKKTLKTFVKLRELQSETASGKTTLADTKENTNKLYLNGNRSSNKEFKNF